MDMPTGANGLQQLEIDGYELERDDTMRGERWLVIDKTGKTRAKIRFERGRAFAQRRRPETP